MEGGGICGRDGLLFNIQQIGLAPGALSRGTFHTKLLPNKCFCSFWSDNTKNIGHSVVWLAGSGLVDSKTFELNQSFF